MLDSIREAGPLKKCAARHGTSKARVIPKNSQKFSLVFACVAVNAADDRKPTRFGLPQVEGVVRMLAKGGPKVFMAKIDVTNCFWSVCRAVRAESSMGRQLVLHVDCSPLVPCFSLPLSTLRNDGVPNHRCGQVVVVAVVCTPARFCT